jgi:hypothetical protein
MNKMTVISVEEKVKVIRQIQNGKKEAVGCREFGIINFSIYKIFKNKTKINSMFKQNGWSTTQFRKSE